MPLDARVPFRSGLARPGPSRPGCYAAAPAAVAMGMVGGGMRGDERGREERGGRKRGLGVGGEEAEQCPLPRFLDDGTLVLVPGPVLVLVRAPLARLACAGPSSAGPADARVDELAHAHAHARMRNDAAPACGNTGREGGKGGPHLAFVPSSWSSTSSACPRFTLRVPSSSPLPRREQL